MKARRLYFLFAILMVAAFLITSCSQETDSQGPRKGEKLKIYTTIYPLYDFAAKIAGEKGLVEKVVPAGVEVHDFEPSPKLVAGIYDADVFVYLGGSIDPWAEKMAGQLSKEGVTVVKAGESLFVEEPDEEGSDDHSDSHVWLDPVLAKAMAGRIAEALAEKDEENASYYRENLKKLENRLDDLDQEYSKVLLQAPKKDFIVNHAAFGYLAKRYNLNQIAISGLSSQQEPSPRKLAELSDLCREKGIKYIMVEASSSSKLANVLAREVGAKVLILHPLENLSEEDMRAGKDYFALMMENLENLKKALNE